MLLIYLIRWFCSKTLIGKRRGKLFSSKAKTKRGEEIGLQFNLSFQPLVISIIVTYYYFCSSLLLLYIASPSLSDFLSKNTGKILLSCLNVLAKTRPHSLRRERRSCFFVVFLFLSDYCFSPSPFSAFFPWLGWCVSGKEAGEKDDDAVIGGEVDVEVAIMKEDSLIPGG